MSVELDDELQVKETRPESAAMQDRIWPAVYGAFAGTLFYMLSLTFSGFTFGRFPVEEAFSSNVLVNLFVCVALGVVAGVLTRVSMQTDRLQHLLLGAIAGLFYYAVIASLTFAGERTGNVLVDALAYVVFGALAGVLTPVSMRTRVLLPFFGGIAGLVYYVLIAWLTFAGEVTGSALVDALVYAVLGALAGGWVSLGNGKLERGMLIFVTGVVALLNICRLLYYMLQLWAEDLAGRAFFP